MDIKRYISSLKVFEKSDNEKGKHALFSQMMYDFSKLGVEEFTQDHLDISLKGEKYFASIEDYNKAKAIRDAISYVKNAQSTKKKIEQEMEKLKTLKKDHGKEDNK